MKKLIILLAVLMMGTASVFAQWDVDVTWSYADEADCQPEHLPSQGIYVIKVSLYIYDEANNEEITTTIPVNTLNVGATSTNFNETQCQVKDYCEESHDNTPSFTVTATVSFYDTSTSTVYCYDSDSEPDFDCTDFLNSEVDVAVVFN